MKLRDIIILPLLSLIISYELEACIVLDTKRLNCSEKKTYRVKFETERLFILLNVKYAERQRESLSSTTYFNSDNYEFSKDDDNQILYPLKTSALNDLDFRYDFVAGAKEIYVLHIVASQKNPGHNTMAIVKI